MGYADEQAARNRLRAPLCSLCQKTVSIVQKRLHGESTVHSRWRPWPFSKGDISKKSTEFCCG